MNCPSPSSHTFEAGSQLCLCGGLLLRMRGVTTISRMIAYEVA